MRALGAALAIALAGCASYPHAQEAAPASTALWRPVDSGTGAIAEAKALEALAAAYPDSGSVRLRLLNAQLGAEDYDAAIPTLRWLYERGYVFSEAARRRLPELVGAERAAQVTALIREPAEPVDASTVFATIPSSAELIESLAIDPDTGMIAVTSVSRHSVWLGSAVGDWREFAPAGAGNLSGIVLDPARKSLWVAAGHIDGGSDEGAGFAGLIAMSPEGAEQQRVAAPPGVNLSDIHRAADGTIFASDPLGGGIYRLRPGSDALEALVPPGSFRSPQGLATSADGKWLYVSDYNYGIAVVPIDGKPIERLATDLPILLDGVDGLWRHGSELIAVQNGTSPMRIVALQLAEDGLRITGHRVLEQARPDWTEPLSGHLGQGALYYVGNGQWDRLKEGRPDPSRPFIETRIRKLPLER